MGLTESLERGDYFTALAWCLLYLLIIGIMFTVIGFALGWFGGVAKVADKELSPPALVAKYRLMLTQQNSLEELNVNIKVYEKQLKDIESQNANISRREWAASDREQYDNIYNAVSASKITFNRLAAQYNSEMKDVLYAFANRADLPTGATVVLNREYVPYQV
jgi:hypothetical protein